MPRVQRRSRPGVHLQFTCGGTSIHLGPLASASVQVPELRNPADIVTLIERGTSVKALRIGRSAAVLSVAALALTACGGGGDAAPSSSAGAGSSSSSAKTSASATPSTSASASTSTSASAST